MDAAQICMTWIISIHAPHTEGDMLKLVGIEKPKISIHAPHTEGDQPKSHVCRR